LGAYRDLEGKIIGCIGMALDITERRKTRRKYASAQAMTDWTGLSTPRILREPGAEVRRASAPGQPFALLLLDLDDLKTITTASAI